MTLPIVRLEPDGQSPPALFVPATPIEALRLVERPTTNLLHRSQFAEREHRAFEDRLLELRAAAAPLPFHRSSYDDIRAFFEETSGNYDSDAENPYWGFAHEILRYLLRYFITEHFRSGSDIRLFDAGAGTGNWSQYVLGLSDRIRGILFDMNPAMLRVAYPKVMNQTNTSVRLVHGNLEVRSDYPSDPSNLILCMHNVIGMGRNTQTILTNLADYLEPGGLAFVMTSNSYHALNFTAQHRPPTEVLRVALDGTVKFKTDMPEMFCYTPDEFEQQLRTAGFTNVSVLGYPVTVYPDAADTKLKRRETLNDLLKQPAARRALLALEQQLCRCPELAYRAGSSLIAVCRKTTVTP